MDKNITRIVVPLYYRRVDEASGIPSSVTMNVWPEEDAELITADNFQTLLPDLSEHGAPRFHVFDLVCEARAADRMLGDDSDRSRGFRNETEIASLRDGEGALMVVNDDRPIADDGFPIADFRSPGSKGVEIYGSWELTAAECEHLMRSDDCHRPDRAIAIAGKLAELPQADHLRDVQVALESIPGAYVGFVSISPDEIRKDYRLEGVEIRDGDIQPQILRASQKAELSAAFDEAVDATIERLMDANPEAFDSKSDEVPEL